MSNSNVQKINKEINVNLHNRFDIEVIRDGEVVQKAVAYNVICNNLWIKIFSGADYFNYIHFGTGTGTPSSVDTSLFTFLGSKDVDSSYIEENRDIGDTTGWYSITRKIRLLPSEYVGKVLTEIGIGYGAGSATLCTHALIKDANGDPITITKTATDVIDIYATVFLTFPTSGNVFATKTFGSRKIPIVNNRIAGSLWTNLCGYNAIKTLMMAYIAISNGNLYMHRTSRSSGFDTDHINVNDEFVTLDDTDIVFNSELKTMTISKRLQTTSGNRPNYGFTYLNLCGAHSHNYTSGLYDYLPIISVNIAEIIGGSDVTGEVIATGDGLTTDFKTIFPYISNATIYVDGIPVESGIALIEHQPFNGDLGKYFLNFSKNIHNRNNIFDYNTTILLGQTNSIVIYNPNWQYGITNFKYNNEYTHSKCKLSASNDGEEWVVVIDAMTYGDNAVPTEYSNMKYWKFSSSDTSSNAYYGFSSISSNSLSNTNIHFDTPPAEGAVITADYHTDVIAKDEYHVFDFTLTIQLGEYVPQS